MRELHGYHGEHRRHAHDAPAPADRPAARAHDAPKHAAHDALKLRMLTDPAARIAERLRYQQKVDSADIDCMVAVWTLRAFQMHRHLADLESELLVEGQRVLDAEDVHGQEYRERLQDYLLRVDDVKKSHLVAYVSRRRVILDLLAKAIRANSDGTHAREDVVHTLLMPMRTTSDDSAAAASNLWVIDESLAFHDFLASGKPIRPMPITESLSPLEPDFLALQVHDGPDDWDLALDGAGSWRSRLELPLGQRLAIQVRRVNDLPMRGWDVKRLVTGPTLAGAQRGGDGLA